LQPLLQRLLNRMLKVPGGSFAVEMPVRLKQVQHPLFDDVARYT
jgi:trans-aconitate methyltransferase